MQTAAVLWFELAVGVFLSIFWFLCAVPLFWPVRLVYFVNLLFHMYLFSHTQNPSNLFLWCLYRSSSHIS